MNAVEEARAALRKVRAAPVSPKGLPSPEEPQPIQPLQEHGSKEEKLIVDAALFAGYETGRLPAGMGREAVAKLIKEVEGAGWTGEEALQEAGPLTQSELDKIWQDTFPFEDTVLLGEMGRSVLAANEQGSNAVLADLNWNLSFALINTNAIRAAEDYAAERVSKVDSATRHAMQSIVVGGLQDGLSADEIAKNIRKMGIRWTTPQPQKHIRDRAHLIAVTELAYAYERGGQFTARYLGIHGVKLQKRWLALRDRRTDDLCLRASDRGWIALEDDYQPGVKVPPMHPACRCAASYRWPEEGDKLEDLESWQPAKAKSTNWRDFADLKKGAPGGRGGDSVLDAIAKRQGFDGKPRILDGRGFLQAEQAGWKKFYRGIDGGKEEAQRYSDQLKYGDYRAGHGIYGNGTYVATGKTVIRRAPQTYEYEAVLDPTASEKVARYYAGGFGKVTVGFLDPKARVINYLELEDLWKKEIQDWQRAKTGVAGPGVTGTGGFTPGKLGKEIITGYPLAAVSGLPDVLQNPGRFAASLGYDAIRVARSDRMGQDELGDQYVVLNRTILHIVEL